MISQNWFFDITKSIFWYHKITFYITKWGLFCDVTKSICYIKKSILWYKKNHNDFVIWKNLKKLILWHHKIKYVISQNQLFKFLAHLSRRLTRWAYRMGLEPASVRPCVRPCVRACVRPCVRPHFQTWISRRPAGRLQPNFIWSIIGVGERLH